LKGDDILPTARVLAIADVLDAMTSTRSYRPALEVEVVLVELERQAGKFLDAPMVKLCVSLFREKHRKSPSISQVAIDLKRRLVSVICSGPIESREQIGSA
jgi:HD-GYP domain-containing protein (c-di-GMP phosphodiesterase class II)